MITSRWFVVSLGTLFINLSMIFSTFAAEKISVFASILPLKHFVEQIGGDRIQCYVMLKSGLNPATYEPKPKQMVQLSKTRIYFAIGVPFESAWLKKFASANPKIRIVHTDADIEKRLMQTYHHNVEAKHSPEKALHFRNETKSHHPKKRGNTPPFVGIKDPHIWTSPTLVKTQARNILHGLLKEDPAHNAIYQANFKKFIARLNALDAELRKTFAGRERVEFMVFHPAWGYFADTYGLRQIPIEIEGKSPKPAQLKRAIEHAQKRGIKVVFVQPQFSTKSAETIAKAIGGAVVFADPLAYNWAENLRKQADAFKAALK